TAARGHYTWRLRRHSGTDGRAVPPADAARHAACVACPGARRSADSQAAVQRYGKPPLPLVTQSQPGRRPATGHMLLLPRVHAVVGQGSTTSAVAPPGAEQTLPARLGSVHTARWPPATAAAG